MRHGRSMAEPQPPRESAVSGEKSIGEFALKAITFILSAGQAGTVQLQATFEGTSVAFGITLGTLTVSCAGQKNGDWTWCAANYMDSGENITGIGQGRFSDEGGRRWRTRGLVTLSDRRILLVDGIFDLGDRTWNGELLERL